MSELKKGEQLSSSTRDNEDPLAGLYQVDSNENLPLEKEALVLLVKMLDNLEEIKALSGNLRKIMTQDKLMETRILNLLRVLVTGAQAEYLIMDSFP
ncbi:MAG: hypothetical protein ACXABF_11255 [Candidatus Thorarchaeota archaeon]|jgi:hypothetical protein